MNEFALRWFAPAKLNLFLHVLGRHDNGYHQLQTLFQLLDEGDTLQFEPLSNGELQLEVRSNTIGQRLPLENNLILQAARLLRTHAGVPALGARISVDKRIPMGGGLGGGSSDAATTLIALNRYWQLNLSRTDLKALGLQLGADVPLFIDGRSAWGEGVGEQLQAVTLPPRWYLVVTPDCTVSTAEIFSHENLTRNSPAITIADFLAGGLPKRLRACDLRTLSGSGASAGLAHSVRTGPDDRNGSQRLCEFCSREHRDCRAASSAGALAGICGPRPEFSGTRQVSDLN